MQQSDFQVVLKRKKVVTPLRLQNDNSLAPEPVEVFRDERRWVLVVSPPRWLACDDQHILVVQVVSRYRNGLFIRWTDIKKECREGLPAPPATD